MKIFRLPVLLLLLFSLAAPLPAQAEPEAPTASLFTVNQVGGITNVVAYTNGALYLNVGPRIVRMAVNPSTPGAPGLPGSYGQILPGIPQDIQVSNGFVYVALGYAGVAVVDAATLQTVDVKTLPGGAYAAALAAGTHYLYVAAGAAGVISYNLGAAHNTLSYTQTTSYNPARYVTDVETVLTGATTGFIEGLFVSANNASVDPAGRGGVMKYDLSSVPDLSLPVQTAEQIDINTLQVTATQVYAAGSADFYVLDLASMAQQGTVPLTYSVSRMSLAPDDLALYALSGGGIDVIDVQTPAAPAVLTAQPFYPGGSVADLAAVDFGTDPLTDTIYLYLADSYAGLSIATTVTTPENLTLATKSYLNPIPASVSVVTGTARNSYVISNSARLLGLNSPQLSVVNPLGSPIVLPESISNAVVSHGLVLGTAGLSGLLRYQIAGNGSLANPDSYYVSGSAADVAVAWPNAVIANGDHGLLIVSLDQPSMALVGETTVLTDFDSDFSQVDVAGNFAFIGDNNGKFRVFDLTDPTGPLPADGITNGTLVQAGILDVKVKGNFAYLATSVSGIRVVDITDPANPAFVSGADVATPDIAQNLAIYNNYLFVAEGRAGVLVLSILPNGHLSPVATIPISGSAIQVSVVQNAYLYVAAQEGGLFLAQSPLFFTNQQFMPLMSR